MLNKKRREGADIPSASLADIAFLLLIFFLLVTTIDVDTGIGMQLPPEPEEDVEPPPIRERNLLNVLVNSEGLVLLDEEPTDIEDVREEVKAFVDNNGSDPELSESPDDAIISLKTDRNTPYRVYIDMLDEVMGAYEELRDQAAQEQFGVSYNQLEDGSAQQEQISDMYPKKISIAEPDEG